MPIETPSLGGARRPDVLVSYRFFAAARFAALRGLLALRASFCAGALSVSTKVDRRSWLASGWRINQANAEISYPE
jgi:hypothetical protein